ncbi:MAG: YetF domain-containing protein [Ilumatobacteraceae bacterium]
MWNSITHLDISIAEKIVRPIIIYAFLVIGLRLSGKRELGQHNALELVVLLAVANAVQNGIIGQDLSITGALIGATTLFAVNWLLEYSVSRNRWLHQVIIGRPANLVTGGVVNQKALRRQRISEADLLEDASEQGARGLSDIDTAVLGANGHVVVTLRPDMILQGQITELTKEIVDLRQAITSRNQQS